MADSRKKCLSRLNRELDDNKPSKPTARLCVTNFRTQNGDYKKKFYVGLDGVGGWGGGERHIYKMLETIKFTNKNFTLSQLL